MRKKTRGFTIVEILTVLAIISLLIAVLLPALNMARNAARTAKQKVQMTSIDQALLAYRNDFGDYPPSNYDGSLQHIYCGAQKLTEALLGWDLLGFHPKSSFTADNANGAYYTGNVQNQVTVNLRERKPRYLELETANAFRLRDVFRLKPTTFTDISFSTYVLCDSFGRTDVMVGTSTVKVGRPILYYRADTSKTQFVGLVQNLIYNPDDNALIIAAAQVNDQVESPLMTHPLINPAVFTSAQYKILDPKITTRPWPHRPDSYILISAGIDGIYGTQDDITNF